MGASSTKYDGEYMSQSVFFSIMKESEFAGILLQN